MSEMRIKELRKRKGWTQAELAKKLKVSQQTIGSWEVGRSKPNIEILTELSRIFNVSIDCLLGKTDKLGYYLKELRGKESLRSISKRIDGQLSHSYISDLEKGFSHRGTPINPSPETLKMLAKAYNVPYERLMELAGYIEKDSHSRFSELPTDLEDALNIVMSFDGKPLTDLDKEAILIFLAGRKSS